MNFGIYGANDYASPSSSYSANATDVNYDGTVDDRIQALQKSIHEQHILLSAMDVSLDDNDEMDSDTQTLENLKSRIRAVSRELQQNDSRWLNTTPAMARYDTRHHGSLYSAAHWWTRYQNNVRQLEDLGDQRRALMKELDYLVDTKIKAAYQQLADTTEQLNHAKTDLNKLRANRQQQAASIDQQSIDVATDMDHIKARARAIVAARMNRNTAQRETNQVLRTEENEGRQRIIEMDRLMDRIRALKDNGHELVQHDLTSIDNAIDEAQTILRQHKMFDEGLFISDELARFISSLATATEDDCDSMSVKPKISRPSIHPVTSDMSSYMGSSDALSVPPPPVPTSQRPNSPRSATDIKAEAQRRIEERRQWLLKKQAIAAKPAPKSEPEKKPETTAKDDEEKAAQERLRRAETEARERLQSMRERRNKLKQEAAEAEEKYRKAMAEAEAAAEAEKRAEEERQRQERELQEEQMRKAEQELARTRKEEEEAMLSRRRKAIEEQEQRERDEQERQEAEERRLDEARQRKARLAAEKAAKEKRLQREQLARQQREFEEAQAKEQQRRREWQETVARRHAEAEALKQEEERRKRELEEAEAKRKREEEAIREEEEHRRKMLEEEQAKAQREEEHRKRQQEKQQREEEERKERERRQREAEEEEQCRKQQAMEEAVRLNGNATAGTSGYGIDIEDEVDFGTIYRVNTLYEYRGLREDDLSFGEDETLKAHPSKDKASDWWYGTSLTTNQVGFFPRTYVEVIEEAFRVRTLYPFSKTRDDDLAFVENEIIIIQPFQDEVSDWWYGTNEDTGESGFFPKSYVENIDPGKPAVTVSVARPVPIKHSSSAWSISQGFGDSKNGMLTVSEEDIPRGSSAPNTPVLKKTTLGLNRLDVTRRRRAASNASSVNGSLIPTPSLPLQCADQRPESPAVTSWASTMEAHELAAIPPDERSRQEAIFELLSTERTYLRDLQMIVNVFYVDSGKYLTQTEQDVVFSNIDDLLLCNTALLSDLEARQRERAGVVYCMGDVFLKHAESLKCYSTFCRNQSSASRFLQKKREEDQWFEVFLKTAQTRPECRALDLSHFLLEPVQRITRYPLLLRQILKWTPKKHPDYSLVKSALREAEKVLEDVNEETRRYENHQKMGELSRILDMEHYGLLDIGGREFVMEGILYKAKSGRKLHAYLFNDLLVLAEPLKELSPKGYLYYLYREPMKIEMITVRQQQNMSLKSNFVGGGSGEDTNFQIAYGSQVIAVKAPSASQKRQWISQLQHYSALRLTLRR
ncbi:uncharacterized protein BYT42DRAFT_578797 [Radiomyces spectabilis]|uniref:uncharacterized protein n=1 Tax=Radiomyces spectabilis TaxID=64574 RepID=UPI0022200950|nr:uncharacterized protein BYT42DRAFT_578797 [Radiomyces spectabilis]KAI8372990.1 hypothetical protein BYT42DRAFT_578797 [Radiomyces spectabilis]